MFKTRIKLLFVNVVILAGVVAIVWQFWPDAMKSHSYGPGYEPGAGMSLYLALLITGVPALIYAVFVYVGLTHLMFGPDELQAYRARRLVESIPMTEGTSKAISPSTQSGKHDFID